MATHQAAVSCDLQQHQQHLISGGSSSLSAIGRVLVQQKRFIKCRSGSDSGKARTTSFKGPVSLSTFREEPFSGVEGGGANGRGGGGGGGGGGGAGGDGAGGGKIPGGLLGAFWRGWDERVRTDPQFPFKVAMEEVVGVGANVIGDMASRPNFGLNELDFVFSTMVVGSILNFTLMYMLAPTASAGASAGLPGLFSVCPPGHMFEPGAYSLAARAGTFIYKGALFATVGFAAGVVGTALSKLLLDVRKKMDPGFVLQNKPPPTILNAATWAAHMGLSSNLRYQALNGLEFGLAKTLPPAAFKASVFATRALNNLLGGYTFVALARATGSQKAAGESSSPKAGESSSPPVVQMEELESPGVQNAQKLD